ncbi:MAG: hypothetical protein WB586_15790 [Chthoniobacterales bacterium]
MSDNLNLLQRNYCRPGTASGKTIHDLFPIERECGQGKALLAKAPEKLLQLQQFDPSGLAQTYLDKATGAELPVFAIFNLAGNHRCAFEITTESVPRTADRASLVAHIPFNKAQAFVKKINERRAKAERFNLISVILGVILGPICIILLNPGIAANLAPLVVAGGSAFGGFLGYILGVSILDWRCPWQKLVITAEFDGILPRETRERARAAQAHFDNLYLIVDQQNRWKSALLADPSPRALDPLLIGELKQGQQSQFFVIDQFELTAAEQYLTDEFATRPA